MNNVSVFFILISAIIGWALGWLTVSSRVIRQHGKHPVFGHLCGFAVGMFSALGLFCIVGSFFDQNETLSTRLVLAFFGLILLAPFFYARQKIGFGFGFGFGSAPAPAPAAIAPKLGALHTLPAEPAPPSDVVPAHYDPPPAAGLVRILDAASGNARNGRAQNGTTQDAVSIRGVELPCVFSFSYQSQDGRYSLRTVNVTGISGNDGRAYLDGFCHERLETRTFRADRIHGDLVDTKTGELITVNRLLSSAHTLTRMAYKPPSPSPSSSTASQIRTWQTAVLFTGFSATRREELEALADSAGWSVRVAVGTTLDYLVTGPKGGPSKIAKACELGVSVINEDAFLALVDA